MTCGKYRKETVHWAEMGSKGMDGHLRVWGQLPLAKAKLLDFAHTKPLYSIRGRTEVNWKKNVQREAFGFLNEWGMDGTYLQSLTLKPSLGCHMACDTQAECAMVTLIDQKT